ncbi:diguanylate cyclase [Roseofilum sp. BLCC_M91]|uniref:Diguanylate cyclase n=1 Tax=Roseofilum halophilum BLCC-M91 TaxID=3022259 RepID=A0ABT7BMC8_9CYAN|nr:diguanylate cyclase [Roseofilum halophilum]MDJ1180354.1 diguanylate cyclase [Roseofilum halophilum BLCC-M91]
MANRLFHHPKTVPLPIYILVPVLLPILVAMSVTGWLSLRRNHQLVQHLSRQWMEEVGDRVKTKLSQDLAFPQELLNSYENFPLEGRDGAIAFSHQNCFWPFLNSFPSLQSISFGLEDSGELIAVHRTEDGELICALANGETNNQLSTYRLGDRGEVKELLDSSVSSYDARKNLWYQNSIIDAQVTLDITRLPSLSHPSIELQLIQPFYYPNQELIGVGKIDFTLDSFQEYLQNINLDFSAEIIVFDRQINPFIYSDNTSRTKNIIEIDLLPKIQQKLIAQNSEIIQIFSHNKQKYWTLSIAYNLPGDRQWWISIIVPEKQVFQAVEINFRNQLLLNLGAVSISIALGSFFLHKISSVLNQLSQNAQQVIEGNLSLENFPHSLVYPLQGLIDRLEKLIQYWCQLVQSIGHENERLLDKVESGTNLLIEAVEKADKANLKLQQSQSLLESIINSSMDGIMAFQSLRDPQGRIIDFEWIVSNQVAAYFFEINTVNLVGKNWLQEINSPNLRSLFDHYVSVVETGHSLELEFPYDRQDQRAWFHVIAVKLGDGLSVNFRDITDRKKSVFELRKMLDEVHKIANTDGLTKVANRRQFDECLYQEWLRLKRDRLPLSIVLCDVDYFKFYNDTYGHQAGDDCLIQVASAIQHSVRRSSDVVARYGGEEFVVLLPNTSEEGAKVVAQLIQSKINDLQIPHKTSKVAATVTMSLGIATLVPTSELSKESLIALADEALYEAKKQGRNRFVVKS